MSSPLDAVPGAPQTQELRINVNGIAVPPEMAAAAVKRCIRAIQIIDKLLPQGFAAEEDLRRIRAGLTGEDQDAVADAGNVIK